MADVVKYLLAFGGGVSLTAAVAIVVFLNPDKAEIWFSWLLALVSKINHGLEKQYVKHDLQGRINDFGHQVETEAPFLAATRVRIEFAKETGREAFLKGD